MELQYSSPKTTRKPEIRSDCDSEQEHGRILVSTTASPQSRKDGRLLVVDFPLPENLRKGYVVTQKLLRIIQSTSYSITVYSSNVPDSSVPKGMIIRPKHGDIHLVSSVQPKIKGLISWMMISSAYIGELCKFMVCKRRTYGAVLFWLILPYVSIVPIILARALGKKVVTGPIGPAVSGSTGRTKFADGLYYLVLRRSQRLTHTYANLLLSDSRGALEQLIEMKQIDRHATKVIYPAIPFFVTDEFKVYVPFESRRRLVCYVGRFSRTKGADILIDVVNKTLAKRSDIAFLIVGQGELSHDLSDLAKKFGPSRVDLREWVAHSEVSNLLNSSRLLIVLSRSEGGPNVLLEAMACGTPAISSRVGIARDIITEGENGFFIDLGNADEITRQIELALDDPALAHVSRKARLSVEGRFSFDSVVARYQEIFDKLHF
jgi:glycosyltransferase involved in cell wall biosynthesis